MERTPEQVHSDLAHHARLSFTQMLRDHGCTCHPYLAVAVVQNCDEELVPLVKLQGHEPRCATNLTGRAN